MATGPGATISGIHDVVVIGAGPAGLAVGACLRRRGVTPTILDRNDHVGDSWRWRYDRLHLHTPRIQSHLPGLRIPRRMGRWVSRDDMVDYLVAYAVHHGLAPCLGVDVRRVDRDGDRYVVVGSEGEWRSRAIVIATGYNNRPVVPEWPGRATFRGELLHAVTYRNAVPYSGRRVLVVGAGSTGAELAADLAETGAAHVWLSIRTPPNIVPRQVAAVPTTLAGPFLDVVPPRLADPVGDRLQRAVVGELSGTGMPEPPGGIVARARRTATVPTIDVGLLEQLRAGTVEPVAAVEELADRRVVLADGSSIEPDVVIAATGYDPHLSGLVGHLDVLDETGRPLVHGRRTVPAAPRMHFVGLVNPLKGLLLQINLDARGAARAIARSLRAAR